MSAVIYEPKRRYEVEIGTTITFVTGIRDLGRWEFHAAYDTEREARKEADRLTEHNEHVRVIDRHATKESN